MQIAVEAGVIEAVKAGETLTVATADVVQVPLPVITVYVVVTVGVTVTDAEPAGAVPLLAVHV
jgi:hypothetical protein